MTRLANVEKAGYFPLVASVTTLILSHISAPQGGRILDPCAGEGTALVALARALHLAPFGVELHEGRAQAARQAVATMLGDEEEDIPRILNDSYQSLITSRDGYNLLYLNPPYDHDDKDGRLEYQWLWRCRPWLQPGGLLVWVVPRHLLKFRKAVRYVLAHFEHIRVYRFPNDTYDRFRQIVLFATRRQKATTPDAEAVDSLRAMGESKEALPPLTAAVQPTFALPPLVVPVAAFTFRSMFVDPAAALAEAAEHGARTSEEWRRHLDPATAAAPLQPLTPLKIGHMNSVIAAGHLNNQVLADGEERLLIKGRSYKSLREESYEEPLPEGGTKLTLLETEVVVTDITTLDSRGQVQSYNGPALEQFLGKWIGKLTGIVASDYPPRYRFDLNGHGPLLNSLSKKRPIPGMNGQTGLLPAQKHAAAAGAPGAVQVADRWHLLKNVREMLEQFLQNRKACLKAAADVDEESISFVSAGIAEPTGVARAGAAETHINYKIVRKARQVKGLTKAEQAKQARRAKREERYQRVHQMKAAGFSNRAIRRELGMHTKTVRKYLEAACCPYYPEERITPSKLDPFRAYVEKRWAEGCYNACQLYREIVQMGYDGSRVTVSNWAAKQRRQLPEPTLTTQPRTEIPMDAKRRAPWSPTRSSWLLVKPQEELVERERKALERMLTADEAVATVHPFVQQFVSIVRQRQIAGLAPWIEAAIHSGVGALSRFAKHLLNDFSAVCAALLLPWSNGQVEGQINRLKFSKRQMYGRANFDLLRRRVIGLTLYA